MQGGICINRIKVLYFSCSGNGKKIAKAIKDNFANKEIELIDITSLKSRQKIIKLEKNIYIVIIFPIYAGDVPVVLKKYLKTLNGENTTTTLIATYGNIHTGKALFNLKNLLKKRGFNIVSGAEIVASHSYNNKRVRLGVDRPNNKEIIMLNNFIIKSIIKKQEINFPKEKTSIFIKILSLIPQNFIRRKSCKIIYENKLCKNCGVCKKICPLGAIDERYKINNRKCIRCLACVNNCSNKAITFSFTSPKFEDFLIHKGGGRKESFFY